MSNIYQLRDENGVLKAELNETIAKLLVMESQGHFRDAKFKDGEEKRLFEFDADYKFGDIEKTGFSINIWKGDKLALKTPTPALKSGPRF